MWASYTVVKVKIVGIYAKFAPIDYLEAKRLIKLSQK